MKIQFIKPIEKIHATKYQEIYNKIREIDKDKGIEIVPDDGQAEKYLYGAIRTYIYNHKLRDKYHVFRQKGKIYIQLKNLSEHDANDTK